jgi:MFS family permease
MPMFHTAGLFAHSESFRMLALTFFFVSIAVLGTVVHFVPMLTDWGLSASKAGATAGLIGVLTIAGRLVVGALLDRAPALVVTRAVLLVVAGGFVVLGMGGAHDVVLGALVLGLAVGAEVDLMAFLVGRYFPQSSYGQVYGAIYAVFLTGGAIGPALSGYLQDITGDDRAPLLADAALLSLAAALTLRLVRNVPQVAL